MENININQICLIKIVEKRKLNNYKYKTKKRFLLKSKSGYFYNNGWDAYFQTEEEILKKYENLVYFENNTVYFKPYIVICLSNGYEREKCFENLTELYDFVKNELGDIKFIKL